MKTDVDGVSSDFSGVRSALKIDESLNRASTRPRAAC